MATNKKIPVHQLHIARGTYSEKIGAFPTRIIVTAKDGTYQSYYADKRERGVVCPTCEGEGVCGKGESDCCGVAGNADYGICPSCKEHCDFDDGHDCEDCGGKGLIKDKSA